MRLASWGLVAWAMGVASGVYGQFAEEITVTGSRLAAVPVRRVLVLSREEVARLPVRSLEDLVRVVAGTGIARRGPFGVQADASFRGTTFEGVLVLLNGVRVNDPQTGHFHLDVPLPLESIEKIEVLTGPASALFGAGAAGGVIAITTSQPQKPSASIQAGSHSLSAFSLSVPWGEGGGFSFSRKESSGFRPDADFMSNQASLTGSWSREGWKGQWLLSAGSKQFGAWTFYSSRFPHQRERTTTGLFTANIERELSQTVKLQLQAGLRQHRDVYLLDKHRPSWYRNRHRTRLGIASLTLTGSHGPFSWALGTEGERDLLASSRLGHHSRNRLGLFGEASLASGPLTFHLQARQDWFSSQARFSPAAGVTLHLARGFVWTILGASSFRLPSFTELYYVSPSSVGDPNLQPERAWTWETALLAPLSGGSLRLSAFHRENRGLIDWLRADSGVYHAVNLPPGRTRGFEVDWADAASRRFTLAYTTTSLPVPASRSAYALTHPVWEASVTAPWKHGRLLVSPLLTYRKPQQRGGFLLLDLQARWPLATSWDLSLSVWNAFDRRYQEIPGVPQPGRWLAIALEWRGLP